MKRILEDMYELLLEQKRALEDLLKLSHEKRGTVIKGNIEALNGIVRQERRALAAINAAEKKRAAMLPDISNELGLGEVTVSAIIEKTEPEKRERFVKLQKELTDLLALLSEVNEENRQLIEAHLEYTDAMLELMVGAEDPLNNFYGVDGKTANDRKKTTGFFDGQI